MPTAPSVGYYILQEGLIMSHGITNEDGAVYALRPAWHGLGEVVDEAPTSAEAMRLAKLSWLVEQKPLAVVDPDTNEFISSTDLVANIRQDTGLLLGAVGPNYKVVQNSEAFAFLDSLWQDEVLRFESAFSMHGGKRVVLLARLPKVDEIADGDEVKRYLLFSTGHDGATGIDFGPTAVRTVCFNTYQLALMEGGISRMSLKHSSTIMDQLAKARDLVGISNGAFDRHTDAARKLAKRRITTAEWDEFLDIQCPVPVEIDPEWTELRERRILDQRTAITRAFREDGRQQVGGIGGTAWAAFNAVTQHVDHMPRKGSNARARSETRFRVLTSGTGHALKQRAWDTACRIADVPVGDFINN